MAIPMSAAAITSQLSKWRVPHKEFKTWSTHNRNHKGEWGGVNGLVIHHTGSDSTDQRALLYDGLSELPGPLCHFGLAQDGTVWLIGWGRTNHAGSGDPATLAHVVNEDYASRTSNLDPRYGNANGVDGNAHFYGVEIWYSGSHGMTPAQYRSLLLLGACIIDYHGWSALSCIAHAEWSSDKWDPGIAPGKTMNMITVRNDIQRTYNAGPEQEAEHMTPELDARLKRIEAAIADLKAFMPVAPWTYRNQAMDDASMAAGKGHVPDMHQRVKNIEDQTR